MRTFIFSLLTLFISTSVLATATPATKQTLSLCSSITGNWSGTFIDRGKLFYNGGPWPIVLQAYFANGRFIGIITSGNSQVPPRGAYIWGECKDNQLKNIKVRETNNSCDTTNSGSISRNSLSITYNWQNPAGMMGTTFDISLQKASESSPKLGRIGFFRQYLATGNAPSLRQCK